MAALGLYKNSQSSNDGSHFEVEALHFNIWMLAPNFWSLSSLNIFKRSGTYSYFIDIGIRLSVSSGSISSLDLCLPGSPDDEIIDLYDEVLNNTINDLIFGTAVESNNGTIRYFRDEETVKETVQKIKNIEPVGGGEQQRYRVHFSSPIKVENAEGSYYLRFRYRCSKPNDIVFSKGWGFAKKGYLIDIGVNDVRETVSLPEQDMSSEMMPIKEFNGFVICPSDFVPVLSSPSFKHTRILETDAWSQYLDSCGPFSSNGKYTIHYWKGRDVSFANPFKAFMHIHKEFGVTLFIVYLLGVATPALISSIIKLLNPS